MISKKKYNYEKYNIEYVEDGFIIGTSTILDFRKQGEEIIIIESDNSVNPTDFSDYLFEKLDLKTTSIVFLDLTNLYGMSKDNFYMWNFIIKNNEFIDENFNNVCYNSDTLNEMQNSIFKHYLHLKFSTISRELCATC